MTAHNQNDPSAQLGTCWTHGNEHSAYHAEIYSCYNWKPSDPAAQPSAEQKIARLIEESMTDRGLSEEEKDECVRKCAERVNKIEAEAARVAQPSDPRGAALEPDTNGWTVDTTETEGRQIVTCHTRVIGGVLCRWWGDGPQPTGVEILDAAALRHAPVSPAEEK